MQSCWWHAFARIDISQEDSLSARKIPNRPHSHQDQVIAHISASVPWMCGPQVAWNYSSNSKPTNADWKHSLLNYQNPYEPERGKKHTHNIALRSRRHSALMKYQSRARRAHRSNQQICLAASRRRLAQVLRPLRTCAGRQTNILRDKHRWWCDWPSSPLRQAMMYIDNSYSKINPKSRRSQMRRDFNTCIVYVHTEHTYSTAYR